MPSPLSSRRSRASISSRTAREENGFVSRRTDREPGGIRSCSNRAIGERERIVPASRGRQRPLVYRILPVTMDTESQTG